MTTFTTLKAPASIDYTSKDWQGFVNSMLQYANVIAPEWDTSSEGDFGVMLVELFAYCMDILSFYGDRLTQEAYLPTATQKLSVLNLAQLLGYIPVIGTPATGTVTFQTSNPGPAVTVPAGTQVATAFNTSLDQPIIYQTNAAVTVAANGGTAVANVTQGITYSLQALGVSDGTASQAFQIAQPNVQSGTISVYVSGSSGNVLWTPINFLVDASPTATVYSIYTDENNLTHIQFGDNINGQIPPVGLTIYATYNIGVGSAGNQPAGSVGVIVTGSISGVTIPLQSSTSTLYQSSAMSGGSDPETINQIRANAPKAYATQTRAVSATDFSSLALNVPGVLMSNAVANHNTSVTLYVLGPNYLAPSTGLQNNILNYFNGTNDGVKKTLAGVSLTIGTPSLVPVDVGSVANNVTLQVLPNYNQAVVLANVTTAVQSVLAPPTTTFGMLLNVSSIYSAIMAVPGVQYVLIPVMTREDVTQTTNNPIQFRQSEIPVAGNFYVTATGGIS